MATKPGLFWGKRCPVGDLKALVPPDSPRGPRDLEQSFVKSDHAGPARLQALEEAVDCLAWLPTINSRLGRCQ